MEIFERDMMDNKKLAYQRYAIQVAQTIAGGFYERDPYMVYEIIAFGEEILTMEGESTRILLLNANGVVEFDSYVGTVDTLLRRNLSQDFPEISRVLRGDFVFARDLYIQTGTPPKLRRVLYAYAAIVHPLEGIIGAVMISGALDGVDAVLSEIRRMLNLYSAIISLSIIVISFVISGFITQPIKELTGGITKMSKGHLNQRIHIRGSTELRQLGEAFNTMSERLEHLDKARNEFVSNASHELKTPLSAIKVLAESLLHMELEDPAIYKEFLTDINYEIDRLNAIITDLLTLVHIDNEDIRLNKAPVELSEVVQRTLKGLQLLAEQRSIQLETDLEESYVLGDSMKLQQVLSNIIDNGIKYTPEGGRVYIQVYTAEDLSVVKVADTGIGIPPEDLKHIFDRFFRVDKARSRVTGGTGLGLSIAHRIVLLHEGSIRVSSRENKGTAFYVELPRYIPPAS